MTISDDQFRELRTLLLDLKCEAIEMRMHMRRQDEALKLLHEFVADQLMPIVDLEEVDVPDDLAEKLGLKTSLSPGQRNGS